ncbi:MAG: arylsulfatase [Hyphococcus sp.]|nr:MAG: arylsulfatase [Marinicaulis sp.]
MKIQYFCLLVMLPLLSCSKSVSEDAQQTATKPNIIIILADDMGYGDLGVNGASRIKTPNIDAIARDGVNFTQFYASANICTPSRAGLMTGRYPIRTGLGYNVVTARDTHGLPETEETVGEIAQRAQYKTKLIGKWHLGRFPDYAPMKHGFDEFYGVPHSNDMPNFALYRGDKKIEEPVEQSTLTKRYTDEAVSFIDASSDKPFLLFISHTMPHIPLYASDDYKGKSDAGVYGDVIEELDANVGRLVKALKENNLYEDTVFIITSDNGPFFEGGTSGLKGGKGSSWEGAYRVPLVFSWPNGKLKKGNNDAISMNIDILPTVAAMVDVTPSASDIDGESLLPILKGEQESLHQYLFYFNNEEVIGVRSQQWKYLTHTYYRKSLGAFEKFDQLDGFQKPYDLLFEAGPAGGEEYSYADRYPEIVSDMKLALKNAREEFDKLRTHPPDQTFPE